MNRWLRRLVYGLLVLIWLIVMSFPALAFLLATRGQVMLGSDPGSGIRLFLVQEPDFEGVGMEWTRPLRRQPTCSQTTVRYLMWEGEAEPVSFCQCSDALTGEVLPTQLQACNPP